MFDIFSSSLLYLFFALQVSICEQLLSNYMDSVEHSSQEDGNFLRPLIVNIQSDQYEQDDVYEYRSLPANRSREAFEDLRKNFRRNCNFGNCPRQPPPPPRRRPTKKYPIMVHCRGLLVYCKKECLKLNMHMCEQWPFLCPKNTIDDLPNRCQVQCIHNYRQMRIKNPNQPKMFKDTNPRFDRFDYY